MMTLLFWLSLRSYASLPEAGLARFVGPFQTLSRTRLPIEHANQESRWLIKGYAKGRRFRALVTCVWMPMASNKYAYSRTRFCQPVAIDDL